MNIFSTKEDTLRYRGFSQTDISNNLTNIPDYDWLITTITKAEVQAVNDNDRAALRRMNERLFAKDSTVITRFTTHGIEESFSDYSKTRSLHIPWASEMEPYIARLVRAINEIGIFTCMSCDGWHDNNQGARALHLWMRDRYSVMWMWIITEYVFGEKWNHSKALELKTWENIWEPDTESYNLYFPCPESQMICRMKREDEEEVYLRNNRYAAFIEANKDQFNSVRDKWVQMIKADYSLIDNVDEQGFLKLRREIVGYIEKDLDSLALKYASFH